MEGMEDGGGRKKQRRALLSIIGRFITAPSGALQLTIHTVHIDLNDNPDRDQCVNGGKLTPNRPLDVAAGSPSPFPLAPPTTLFLPPTAPPLMQKTEQSIETNDCRFQPAICQWLEEPSWAPAGRAGSARRNPSYGSLRMDGGSGRSGGSGGRRWSAAEAMGPRRRRLDGWGVGAGNWITMEISGSFSLCPFLILFLLLLLLLLLLFCLFVCREGFW